MENLLLIEVFKGEISSICKKKRGSKESETTLLDTLKDSLNEFNQDLYMKIRCTFDMEGNIFFPGNVLMAEVYHTKASQKQSIIAISTEDLINQIKFVQFSKKKEKKINLKEYKNIIFQKDIFMMILLLTQQYLMMNDEVLEQAIDLSVLTSSGVSYIFENGKSNAIVEPIMGIQEFKNILIHPYEINSTLWVINFNNCMSSIQFANGDFTFSFQVQNEFGENDCIYVKRSFKEFWNQLRVYEKKGDIFFGIFKEN